MTRESKFSLSSVPCPTQKYFSIRLVSSAYSSMCRSLLPNIFLLNVSGGRVSKYLFIPRINRRSSSSRKSFLKQSNLNTSHPAQHPSTLVALHSTPALFSLHFLYIVKLPLNTSDSHCYLFDALFHELF